MNNDPYERVTLAEAVRHVLDAEQNINVILKRLCETTGMRIEVDVYQAEIGAPKIILSARVK